MNWPQTGATQYYAQLRLPDKDLTIRGLIVYNGWELQPLDLLNGLILSYYQQSPEEVIKVSVCISQYISIEAN